MKEQVENFLKNEEEQIIASVNSNVKCKLFDLSWYCILYVIVLAMLLFLLPILLWCTLLYERLPDFIVENLFIICGLLSVGLSPLLIAVISYPTRKKRLKSFKRCIKKDDIRNMVLGCYVCSNDYHFMKGCKCQCGRIRKEHNWDDDDICKVCGVKKDKEPN
jgi:archaellum biogenesis protein FlaJ (TadC family)